MELAWTEVQHDLNTARRYVGGAGTQTVCFSFWWNSQPASTATEEFGNSSLIILAIMATVCKLYSRLVLNTSALALEECTC